MITNLLLLLLYGFVYIVTSPMRLFADVALDSTFDTLIEKINSILGLLGTFINLNHLSTAIYLIFVFEGLIVTIKLTLFALKKIPGIN